MVITPMSGSDIKAGREKKEQILLNTTLFNHSVECPLDYSL